MNKVVKQIHRRSLINCTANNLIIKNEYELAIESYMEMTMNSRVCFNIAMVYMALNEFERSVFYFRAAIHKDPWLAIGYFYFGVLLHQNKQYEYAVQVYDKCLYTFRDHSCINYHNLGLTVELEKSTVTTYLLKCYYALGNEELAQESLPLKATMSSILNTPVEFKLSLFKNPNGPKPKYPK